MDKFHFYRSTQTTTTRLPIPELIPPVLRLYANGPLPDGPLFQLAPRANHEFEPLTKIAGVSNTNTTYQLIAFYQILIYSFTLTTPTNYSFTYLPF